MGRSPQQSAAETARKQKDADPTRRYLAPGVYFGTDGMLTADCLDSAILYLRNLAEPRVEPPLPSDA